LTKQIEQKANVWNQRLSTNKTVKNSEKQVF